jgi:hypothetical protein
VLLVNCEREGKTQTKRIFFFGFLCTVLLVDFVREGKTQTTRVYASLSLLLLGVGLATVTDVEASLKGVMIALIGQQFSKVKNFFF